MPLPDQLSLLCIAVEEKARVEAGALIDEARKNADKIIQSAKQDMKLRLEHRLVTERENAAREASRIVDAAELKARQFILHGKKQILSMLIEDAAKRLDRIRSGAVPGFSYEELLKTLAVRAVSGIPGEKAVLKVNEQDREFFTSAMISDISRETGKEITLSPEAAVIRGGCMAYSLDSRQMVDCSFDALLKEAEPALMELLADQFMKSGSSEKEKGEH